jgi:hypothetical protein
MQTIVAVLFTYSWNGPCVRYRDGTTESLSPKQLLVRVGKRALFQKQWANSWQRSRRSRASSVMTNRVEAGKTAPH